MYKLIANDGAARLGSITIDLNNKKHTIDTPAFMPVATQGALKGPLLRDAVDAGAQIILANTYHLILRPGLEELENYGGLHRFISWDKPILTDSGGYQVFSLAGKITPDGVHFTSPIDGSKLFLSPDSAVEAQHIIGANIIMCLDECLAYPATEEQARKSMDLSVDWAKKCQDKHKELLGLVRESDCADAEDSRHLFGIVQGGVYKNLRKQCAEELMEMDFDGYALGGLAVGESQEEMLEITEFMKDILPKEEPRYLMGVGTPLDLVEAVARGVDMFDCVLPTRNARNGQLFTRSGVIKIRNAQYRGVQEPPDDKCQCYCCQNYSLGYLHHLFRCEEMSAAQLAACHNLFFYQELMQQMRDAIERAEFGAFVSDFRASYTGK